MQAIVFIGLPGTGKSSFYSERFFATHVRISMDLLKTRHREQRLIDVCLDTGQPLVIDNTNPSREERFGYIWAAKSKRFTVIGYYFQSKVEDCLRRNAERSGKSQVPEVAILAAARRLALPSRDEGFDQLHYVCLKDGRFIVEEWRDDL